MRKEGVKGVVPLWCSGECTEIKCVNWSPLQLLVFVQVSVIFPDALCFLPESMCLHVLYEITSNNHSSAAMC